MEWEEVGVGGRSGEEGMEVREGASQPRLLHKPVAVSPFECIFTCIELSPSSSCRLAMVMSQRCPPSASGGFLSGPLAGIEVPAEKTCGLCRGPGYVPS